MTTYYIDPSVATNGTGTEASPFKSWSNVSTALFVAGNSFLQRRGTRDVYAGATNLPVIDLNGKSGALGNPIYFGAYGSGDMPIVDGGALSRCGIGNANNAAPSNYITVDGLAFTNINPTSTRGALFFRNDGIAPGQGLTITNCRVFSSAPGDLPADGISWNHYSSVTVTGNEVVGCIGPGINETCGVASPLPAQDISIDGNTVTDCYNSASSTGQGAIQVWSFNSTVARTLSNVAISNNTVSRISNVVPDRQGYGIKLLASTVASRIECNNVSHCVGSGIGVDSPYVADARVNHVGLVVADNVCSRNMMGIYIGAVADVVVERNLCEYSGSFDGVTCSNSSGYGRGIEVYGTTANKCPKNIIIRWNRCVSSYNFDLLYATEGVGIGLDDRSDSCVVYGNYVADNEGAGIEIKYQSNLVFGNVIRDNWQIPASRLATVSALSPTQAHEIGIRKGAAETGALASASFFNNTIICSRTKHGVWVSPDQYAASLVANNIVIGASDAAIVAHQTYTTVEKNCILGSLGVARSDTVTIDFAKTASQTMTDPQLDSASVPANKSIVGAGQPIPLGLTDFNGNMFNFTAPTIGAVEVCVQDALL